MRSTVSKELKKLVEKLKAEGFIAIKFFEGQEEFSIVILEKETLKPFLVEVWFDQTTKEGTNLYTLRYYPRHSPNDITHISLERVYKFITCNNFS